MSKTILAIGLDPAFANLSEIPELSVDLVRAFIDQQIGRMSEHGFYANACLIDRGETAEMTVENALRAQHYDCIVIGAGLREPPELLNLFERIINIVHKLAPDSRIAFNTTPADTAEAALRWIG